MRVASLYLFTPPPSFRSLSNRSDWHHDRKRHNRSASRSPSESPEKPKPKTAEEREVRI